MSWSRRIIWCLKCSNILVFQLSTRAQRVFYKMVLIGFNEWVVDRGREIAESGQKQISFITKTQWMDRMICNGKKRPGGSGPFWGLWVTVLTDVSGYTFLPLKILPSVQNFLGNVVPRKSNFPRKSWLGGSKFPGILESANFNHLGRGWRNVLRCLKERGACECKFVQEVMLCKKLL